MSQHEMEDGTLNQQVSWMPNSHSVSLDMCTPIYLTDLQTDEKLKKTSLSKAAKDLHGHGD